MGDDEAVCRCLPLCVSIRAASRSRASGGGVEAVVRSDWPGFFLAWAKRTDLAVPSELEAAVTARGIQIADWKTHYDELKKKFDECQTQWLASSEEQSEQIDRLRGRNDELQTQLAAAALAPHDRPEKSLATRERDSLFKLVIGMAVGGYRYDATAFRSKHPAEIANDLASRRRAARCRHGPQVAERGCRAVAGGGKPNRTSRNRIRFLSDRIRPPPFPCRLGHCRLPLDGVSSHAESV